MLTEKKSSPHASYCLNDVKPPSHDCMSRIEFRS